MSKRSFKNGRRRQVRRVLNAIGDTLTRVGSRKIMRLSYGCALSRGDVRNEQKGIRMSNANEVDTIY